MTKISPNMQRAVRLAIAGVAAAAAGSGAFAQTASVANTGLEEIIVTGSRIQQSPNSVSVAPIATITSEDIKKTGLVRVEDLLNNMPQVIAENGSGQSISSDGTATVSLRGLGSFRTLVLINGHRMQPGASGFNAGTADINQIPASMIERVDVLTGGASATYGADAVAGVVNFIMNTHFEGVKIDFDYGFNSYGQKSDFAQDALTRKGLTVPDSFTGGQNRNWSFAAGSNFADGRGNASVYATYLNTSAVPGYALDYAACTLNSQGGPATATRPATWAAPRCGGSGTAATGQFIGWGVTSAGGFSSSAVDHTVDKTTGAFRPFTGADTYNYGALSYAQRQAERYTAGAFLNYDITERMNVYSETMYSRNTSTGQYGPSGSFFEFVTMSCTNPLLRQDEYDLLCAPAVMAANQAANNLSGTDIALYVARRNVEGPGRSENFTGNSIRQVIGLKGSFGKAWTYDAAGQFGITTLEDLQGGYLGVNQIRHALDVVPNPAVGGLASLPVGAPVCRTALDKSDPTCVPWNVWNKGGVTADQLAYLNIGSTFTTTAKEYIVGGSVTGDLGNYGIKIPSARDPVIVNMGTEWRQEDYDFEPDYVFSNGLASGGNPAGTFATVGAFHVNEYFMETRVPIIDNMPGAYHVGLEGGYRYSDYSLGFKTSTHKLGLEWAPVQSLKLRGSYNRAIRAPNISELFSPAPVGAGGNADPCWSATPQFTQAECANTGVTAAQYGSVPENPAAQINNTTGGDPSLQPEKADTYTMGFVLQPRAVPGFFMSLDYYDIKIGDTITNISTDVVLTNCAKTGDPTYCSRIHRNPQNGNLWRSPLYYVNTNSQNIGTVTTKGYDLATRYNLGVGSMGKLNFTLSGTYVTDWSTQPDPLSASYDCTGLEGASCGAPTPKWKHTFQTDWATPWAGLVLTGRWRYIGAVDSDRTSSDPQLRKPYQPGFAHINAYNYIDLAAAISWGDHTSFRVGINNVTDKPPPIILNGRFSDCPNTSCNDNTWVGTYDTLGRYIYAHVTAKF